MNPVLLKKFIPSLISLLCVAVPPNLSDACGWSGDMEDSYTVILDRAIWSPRDPVEFYYYNDVMFNFGNKPQDDRATNIQEWQTFLGNLDSANTRLLVYDATPIALADMEKKLNANTPDNGLLNTLSAVEWKTVIPYLSFVRRCQPYVSDFDDWAGCFDRSKAFSDLFAEGEAIAAKATDPFMKVRIGYQLCRLAQYSGDSERCINYFEHQVKPLNPVSIVYYWGMGHYAAALKTKGLTDDAMVQYARVYRRCESRRASSFQSMDYSNITAALARCDDPQDKIALYVMNSLENAAAIVHNLDEMYTLDPDSPEIELLLFKELHTLEQNLGYGDQSGQPVPVELQNFVQKVADGGKMYRPFLWHMTAGYIAFLNKVYDKADAEYTIAMKASATPYQQQQLFLLKTLLKTSQATDIDGAFESSLGDDLAQIDNIQKTNPNLGDPARHTKEFVYRILQQQYAKHGQDDKAMFISQVLSYGTSLHDNMDVNLINKMIAFASRSDLNSFERTILAESHWTRDALLEYVGTIYFRNGDLQTALTYFDQVQNLTQITSNAFDGKTIDCHSCEEGEKALNKAQMVRYLLYLETNATTVPKNAAENYWRLGNAWYNMTNYGSSW